MRHTRENLDEVTNLQTRRRKTIQDQKLHRNITACRHQKRIIGYALIP
jgi:hypothetical protein